MNTHWTPHTAAVISIVLAGVLSACGGPVEFEEERSPSEASFEEENSLSEVEQAKVAPNDDCPPNLPPCDCALAGTYACMDTDWDGLVNMDDNCDSIHNPHQSNCDNDSLGDACDNLSATQTKSKYSVFQYSYYGSYNQCYWNQHYYQKFLVYDEYEQVTTSYCAGPQAGQTATTTTHLRTYTAMCFEYMGYCPVNSTSFMPQPWCG